MYICIASEYDGQFDLSHLKYSSEQRNSQNTMSHIDSGRLHMGLSIMPVVQCSQHYHARKIKIIIKIYVCIIYIHLCGVRCRRYCLDKLCDRTTRFFCTCTYALYKSWRRQVHGTHSEARRASICELIIQYLYNKRVSSLCCMWRWTGFLDICTTCAARGCHAAMNTYTDCIFISYTYTFRPINLCMSLDLVLRRPQNKSNDQVAEGDRTRHVSRGYQNTIQSVVITATN